MKRRSMGWAVGLAGVLLVTTMGCADEKPEATSATAAPEQAAPSAAQAVANVKTEQVVNPGPTLPKGKVEHSAVSPNGLVQVVFLDEGEKGDWFWRSLYVTAGAHNMDLGRYTEFGELKWNPDGDGFTAEVKAGTASNKLTTYLLTYRVGAETYELKELKVEDVESAG